MYVCVPHVCLVPRKPEEGPVFFTAEHLSSPQLNIFLVRHLETTTVNTLGRVVHYFLCV